MFFIKRVQFIFYNIGAKLLMCEFFLFINFQSVIQMSGFRSLGDSEDVEFECQPSEKGFEATRVSGPLKLDCSGSSFRPSAKRRFRKIRCYNCGEFANHIAAKCSMGPQPKKCHHCKCDEHLIADCPMKPVSTLIPYIIWFESLLIYLSFIFRPIIQQQIHSQVKHQLIQPTHL